MNTCENFRLEIYKDGAHEMAVIKADIPNSTGMNYIWFVLTKLEFIQLCSGRRASFEDGYHLLRTFGDMFMFYDMENWPRDNHGEMNIKYINLTIPHKIQAMMLKRAHKVWDARKDDGSTERTTIEFSKKLCDRLLRRYGCGKGKAKVEFPFYNAALSQQSFELCLGKPEVEHSFERSVDHLLTIAKNQTQAYNEIGRVKLCKDGQGFVFDILAPNNNSIMYGGLINHGTKDDPDWSIHT